MSASRFKDLALVAVNALFALGAVECGILFLLNNPAFLKNFPKRPLEDVRALYFVDRTILQFEPGFARYDADLFYTLKPGTFTFSNREFSTEFRVNSLGVRDDEESLVAPEIVVLGDSQAMGWGVDQNETFAQRLEAKSGRRVLNAAISSYGTPREIRILDRIDVSKLKVVIIQYDPNDLEENESYFNNKNKLVIGNEAKYRDVIHQYEKGRRYFVGRYTMKLIWWAIKPGQTQAAVEAEPRREVVRLFFNTILNVGRQDLSHVRLIVVDVTRDDEFIRTLREMRGDVKYPAFIRNMTVLDLSKQYTDEDYYFLDKHLNAKGHQRIADAILQSSSNLSL